MGGGGVASVGPSRIVSLSSAWQSSGGAEESGFQAQEAGEGQSLSAGSDFNGVKKQKQKREAACVNPAQISYLYFLHQCGEISVVVK